MHEQQGTEAWLRRRVGKVTASRVADVVARTRNGYGASRANYMGELIAERLTGQTAPSFTNAAMQWGTQTEPEARIVYGFVKEVEVAETGFIDHPAIAMTGASPDGLVGADGLVEIKAPNTSTHIETLLTEAVPAKYITQMQWQMACTGRAWCDFVSFDPRLPSKMDLFVKRFDRDDEMIASLEAEVSAFLAELDEKVAALLKVYGGRDARAA